jgi:hypothetical protein
MATTTEVIKYLRPNGGYVVYDGDLNTMIYDEGVAPITQKEFDEAVDLVDAQILADQAAKEAAKALLLERLGITSDEAKLLLG